MLLPIEVWCNGLMAQQCCPTPWPWNTESLSSQFLAAKCGSPSSLESWCWDLGRPRPRPTTTSLRSTSPKEKSQQTGWQANTGLLIWGRLAAWKIIFCSNILGFNGEVRSRAVIIRLCSFPSQRLSGLSKWWRNAESSGSLFPASGMILSLVSPSNIHKKRPESNDKVRGHRPLSVIQCLTIR